MSELTTCNYCNLKSMRKPLSKMSEYERSYMKKFRKLGDRHYLIPQDGGLAVYRVRKGDKLRVTDPDKDPKSQWVAWFGGLTDHCVC